MEVYTIGSGEIVFEVLKAVSLCLNGGSGLLQAMLTIGGFSGVFIVYYIILYGNIQEVIKSWGIPVLLVTNMLFIPTTTVWVIDTITKYHYKIDHVPYGLALFSSQTSKFGKAITEIVEQNFSLVDDLKYQKNGMVFGSDILEKAKTFRITNRNFKENMRNFVGQCVKYDIMLNQKYSFDDLRNTNNLWELITSNPSEIRGLYWIPIASNGKAIYVTCKQAVEKFNQVWSTELDKTFSILGRKFFSGRSIRQSTSNSPKFTMNASMEEALKAEIKANFANITAYLGEIATNAEETLKQALLINAIEDAASENSKASGNAITYAETRALQQQNTSFDTIGRLAAKLLPIMKAVIEALAYACFIFIIPFCMIPNGYKFLMNWIAVLIWLQAWPPMYAILNYIMNIAARASTLSEIGTAGGLTIANYIGVSEANAEIKLLAGYLSMSIPFICIAIVKGVDTFVNLAGQMTGTSMQVASTTAGEVTTGNFSFGNISMRNRQADNVSQLQRNFSSSIMAGGHILDTGTMQRRSNANGFTVRNYMQDTGPRSLNSSVYDANSQLSTIRSLRAKQKSLEMSYNSAMNISKSLSSQIVDRISHMNAQELANSHQISNQQAESLITAAKQNIAYERAKQASGTTGSQITGQVSGGFSIGGIGASVSASGTIGESQGKSWKENEQVVDDKTYNDNTTMLENYMNQISNSNRDDDVTSMAKEKSYQLQEASSFSEHMRINESRIQQVEDSFQNTVTHSVSINENKIRDFTELAQKKEGKTPQQAHDMFQLGEYNGKWKAIADEATGNRQYMFSKKPQIAEINFSEQDLRNKFETQQIDTKQKINENEKQIQQKRLQNEQTFQKFQKEFDSKKEKQKSEIVAGKNDIEKRKEIVKNEVLEKNK